MGGGHWKGWTQAKGPGSGGGAAELDKGLSTTDGRCLTAGLDQGLGAIDRRSPELDEGLRNADCEAAPSATGVEVGYISTAATDRDKCTPER